MARRRRTYGKRSRKRSTRKRGVAKRKRYIGRRKRRVGGIKRSFKASARAGLRGNVRPIVKRYMSVPEGTTVGRAKVNLDYHVSQTLVPIAAGSPIPTGWNGYRGNDPWDPQTVDGNESALNWAYWAARYNFYRCNSSTISVKMRFSPMFDPAMATPWAQEDVIVGVFCYPHLEGFADPFPNKEPTDDNIALMQQYPGMILRQKQMGTQQKGVSISFKTSANMYGLSGDRYAYQDDPCTTIESPQSRFIWTVGYFRRVGVGGSGPPGPTNGAVRVTRDITVRYPCTFFGRVAGGVLARGYQLAESEQTALAPRISGFSDTHTAVYEPDGQDPTGATVPVYSWYPPTTAMPQVIVPPES